MATALYCYDVLQRGQTVNDADVVGISLSQSLGPGAGERTGLRRGARLDLQAHDCSWRSLDKALPAQREQTFNQSRQGNEDGINILRTDCGAGTFTPKFD